MRIGVVSYELMRLCSVAREGNDDNILSACGRKFLKALPDGRHCRLRVRKQLRLAAQRVCEKTMKGSRISTRAREPIDFR